MRVQLRRRAGPARPAPPQGAPLPPESLLAVQPNSPQPTGRNRLMIYMIESGHRGPSKARQSPDQGERG